MSAIGTLLQAANLAVNAQRQPVSTGLGFLDDGYDDQWEYDGYGWYDGWGNYYDPYSDMYYDAMAGDWYGASTGYYQNYFENPDGSWQLYDPNGSVYSGGADGSQYFYDATTGDEFFIGASGDYTWVDASGNSYYVDVFGNWTSTGADGLVCYGDYAGNGGCNDGTAYNATGGRNAGSNPIRNAAEAARSALSGGSGSSGSGSQQRLQQQQQQRQQQQRPNTPGVNPNASLFSESDKKTLLFVGLGIGALMLLKK